MTNNLRSSLKNRMQSSENSRIWVRKIYWNAAKLFVTTPSFGIGWTMSSKSSQRICPMSKSSALYWTQCQKRCASLNCGSKRRGLGFNNKLKHSPNTSPQRLQLDILHRQPQSQHQQQLKFKLRRQPQWQDKRKLKLDQLFNLQRQPQWQDQQSPQQQQWQPKFILQMVNILQQQPQTVPWRDQQLNILRQPQWHNILQQPQPQHQQQLLLEVQQLQRQPQWQNQQPRQWQPQQHPWLDHLKPQS